MVFSDDSGRVKTAALFMCSCPNEPHEESTITPINEQAKNKIGNNILSITKFKSNNKDVNKLGEQAYYEYFKIVDLLDKINIKQYQYYYKKKFNKNIKLMYFIFSLLLRIVQDGGLQITKNFFKKNSETKKTYDLSIYNQLSNCKRYDFEGTLTTPPFYQNAHWGLYNTNEINKLQLSINQSDYDEYIFNYINTKANVQCQYQSSRYVNKCSNFLVVKHIIPVKI